MSFYLEVASANLRPEQDSCLGLPFITGRSVLQPTDWTIKINKKERRLAVATALQSAAGDIKVIEDIKVRSQCLF